MNLKPATIIISSLGALASAARFGDNIDRVTHDERFESDDSETMDERALQSNCGFGNSPKLAWHPIYSAGWTNGYCHFTTDCHSPAYLSELACCKGAYGGQYTGFCLSRLPGPPTTAPTETGGLDVYYLDYTRAWPRGQCLNIRPMPSERPTYSTMLECCKAAYAGQILSE